MHYKTYLTASKAAQELRKQYDPIEIMVKIIPSPYGGYSVTLVPVDLMIENLFNHTASTKISKNTASHC